MYEIWKLYVENYSSWQSSVTSTFDLFTPKCKLLKLSCQNQSVYKVQWPWPLDPKMYRYLSHHPASMYEIWKLFMLKTTQLLVSESKCWHSSVVTFTFDPKCIGIFLSPSCIYVWKMKAVRWKLLKILCQNQSVYNVQWPWPFDSLQNV